MSELVYVAFGDSITDGYGVTRGFVSWLADSIRDKYSETDWTVITRGMSGENSRDGLYRLGRDVLGENPFLVTINFGVNDAFSGISPVEFNSNMQDMVRRIQEAGCSRIVLLSSEVIPDIWAEKQVLPYWDAMMEAAEETGAVYADVNGYWQRKLDSGRPERELIIPGDIHPNEDGHRLIAEAVFNAVVESRLPEDI
jgi:lysophospholipase L1-like esterase